jgi:hypothetical protein
MYIHGAAGYCKIFMIASTMKMASIIQSRAAKTSWLLLSQSLRSEKQEEKQTREEYERWTNITRRDLSVPVQRLVSDLDAHDDATDHHYTEDGVIEPSRTDGEISNEISELRGVPAA